MKSPAGPGPDLIGAWPQPASSQSCPPGPTGDDPRPPEEEEKVMTSLPADPPGVIVGVDTHQDVHVAVALDALGRRLGELQIAATTSGYAQLDRCAALRPGPVTTPTAAAKQALRSLAHRAIALAAEAAALGTQLDELTTAVAPALRALTGIGPDGAAALLTAAGDNPDRIHSEAGFAALCGTNPIPASSGKTTRYRLNRGGNRQANAALHRAVITRLRHHEPTKAYMQRRLTEGKSTKEILRCLKRYLAREVYHQLNPTTPSRNRPNDLPASA